MPREQRFSYNFRRSCLPRCSLWPLAGAEVEGAEEEQEVEGAEEAAAEGRVEVGVVEEEEEEAVAEGEPVADRAAAEEAVQLSW